MFDQSQNTKTVDVFVTLIDGRELFGALACGLKANVANALNGDGQFIELHDYEGDATFIGKHQIASLEKAKRGVRKQSTLEAASKDHANWQETLGVTSSCSVDKVKEVAFQRLQQLQDDCLLGVRLPNFLQWKCHLLNNALVSPIVKKNVVFLP